MSSQDHVVHYSTTLLKVLTRSILHNSMEEALGRIHPTKANTLHQLNLHKVASKGPCGPLVNSSNAAGPCVSSALHLQKPLLLLPPHRTSDLPDQLKRGNFRSGLKEGSTRSEKRCGQGNPVSLQFCFLQQLISSPKGFPGMFLKMSFSPAIPEYGRCKLPPLLHHQRAVSVPIYGDGGE